MKSKSICFVLILFSLLACGKDNRLKTVTELPLFGSSPSTADLIDSIHLSGETRLLATIGRLKTGQEENPFPYSLVWHSRVALHNGDYLLCIFEPPFRSLPGNTPRVIVLLDHDQKFVTWTENRCEPAFGYASIAQSIQNTETHLITVNPATRFGGELFFERYKIESTGITKLGEGYDPSALKSIKPGS